ncbi:MAG TPA: HlyD family efflux transporter periplasmic adaptor subunit [Haliangium sp.]|nr:HlyD family efflux transporter periplasmic adaptor subunit [Haliangium sp.]
MPASFHKTLGALAVEHHQRRRVVMVVLAAGALLAAWTYWLVDARVPVYAVSRAARIQASDEVHPVDVYTPGRVTSVHLPVGGRVQRGDVLLELDATDTRLQLDEVHARIAGMQAQMVALQQEIAAREQAIAETERAGKANLSEAAALQQESTTVAGLAAQEGQRTEQLYEAGVVPEAERSRARASVEQSQALATARRMRLAVVQTQARLGLAERKAEKASLERSLASMQADLQAAEVQRAKLREQLARHVVRAPVAGVLGQVQAPRIGSMVETGQTVAVITPEGGLTVVADFAPLDAVGRVRVGQRARMRADGFPWTQYGTLAAHVSAVSGEAEGGLVRATLTIADPERTPIPLRHGITGSVEVEIEEVSPATLLMRAAGGLLRDHQGWDR